MSDHYPVEVLMRFSYRKSASKREISTSHQTSASYVTSSTRRHLICALALLAIQTLCLNRLLFLLLLCICVFVTNKHMMSQKHIY